MSNGQRIGLAWLIVNTGVYVKSGNEIITALAISFMIIGTYLLISESK